MAVLIFLDSFDHWTWDEVTRKWTESFAGNGSLDFGRNGYAFKTFAGDHIRKTFESGEYSELCVGFAYKTSSFGGNYAEFRNARTGFVFGFTHVGDGRLTAYTYINPNQVTSLPTPSSFVMRANEWYYFECYVKVTSSGQVGATTDLAATFDVILRVNENPVINTTLSATYAGSYSATTPNQCRWASLDIGGPAGVASAWFDDLWLTDGEFLGDVNVAVLYPNASGAYTQWSPSGTSPAATGSPANWDMTEEHPGSDEFGTFVMAGATGLMDSYNLDDIPGSFSGTIKGAQALWLVRKTDAGEGAIRGTLRSGSTDIERADFYPSHLSWLYDIDPMRKSIFTSGDWTVPEINALEQGIKRIK
jgi:hypothetical protein